MRLTRRGLVAGGMSLAVAGGVAPTRRAGAADGSVTIAYNVGLPSWDPTVGPSAVNPTIQAIYQSVFDQYVGQNPDLSFTARPAREMGLERRRHRGVDGRAQGRRLARRLAVHARRRGRGR